MSCLAALVGRNILLIVACLSACLGLYGQSTMGGGAANGVYSIGIPKTEIRAVWLTTFIGLDFPKTKAVSEFTRKQQQEELTVMLDRLQRSGINVVFFQARMRGDLAYESKIETFNPVFTGRVNGNPGYDPLAFAIEECHKRGMECHAWIVTTRMGTAAEVRARRNLRPSPSLTLHEGQYFLDPGKPETEEYLAGIVRELVQNYDIDGVQFDYLRYPENAGRFADAATYRTYGNEQNKATWRRDNITRILRRLHREAKAIKPYIKVSTCPIGKHADLPRYSAGGFTAYDAVHQDVKQWLDEGLQDWLCPMMYYRNDYFEPFVQDWCEAAGRVPVAIGLGIYFLDAAQRNGNWSLQDIEGQISYCRAMGAGVVFFRTQFLLDNVKGLLTTYQRHYANALALLPPIAGEDAPIPAPASLKASYTGQQVHLSWHRNSQDEGVFYNIYASDTYPVNTDSAENLVAVRISGTSYIHDATTAKPFRRYFAVTAYDRYNRESEAAQLQVRYGNRISF